MFGLVTETRLEQRIADVSTIALAAAERALAVHVQLYHRPAADTVKNTHDAELRALKLVVGSMKADAVECPECKGKGHLYQWVPSRLPTTGSAGIDTMIRAQNAQMAGLYPPQIGGCSLCRGYGRIWPITCKCGKEIGVDMVDVRKADKPACPWCGQRLSFPYNAE